MKQIRAILVDDEPRGLNSLHKLLDYNCPEVEVLARCGDADSAKQSIDKYNPDLVFLDIAMPGKSGIDLLYEYDLVPFEVIFVTAHGDYTIQAMHLSAVDYLLKPVDDDLLIGAVKRAGLRITKKVQKPGIETLLHNLQPSLAKEKMKLCIPSMKGFQVVEIANIIYCEASSNYTYFHFTDRADICASKPIHEYESLLEDSDFIRVHKTFLVNIAHIQEYLKGEGGSVLVTGGKTVEVSRRRKELLLKRIKVHFKF